MTDERIISFNPSTYKTWRVDGSFEDGNEILLYKGGTEWMHNEGLLTDLL